MQLVLEQITSFHLFVVHASLPGKENWCDFEKLTLPSWASVSCLLGLRWGTTEKVLSCMETISSSSLLPLKLSLCFSYIFYCMWHPLRLSVLAHVISYLPWNFCPRTLSCFSLARDAHPNMQSRCSRATTLPWKSTVWQNTFLKLLRLVIVVLDDLLWIP